MVRGNGALMLATCLQLQLPSGRLLEQRGAWDTRMINTYSAEQRTWPEHSHSWMRAWLKTAIGCAVISAACGIPAMDLPEIADQANAQATRGRLWWSWPGR